MTKTCAIKGKHSRALLDVRHGKREVLELKHYNKEGQIHKEEIAEKVQHN